jgi:hypothetical protein
MPKKPKPLSEQSRRFIERAEEIGAGATEEEFERHFRKAVPPKRGMPAARTTRPKKR